MREGRVRDAWQKLRDCIDRDQGIKTAEGVRALASLQWEIAHDQNAEGGEMLNMLALASGMAMGVLHDYAKRLEEEGQ